jgi:hypothetical protein
MRLAGGLFRKGVDLAKGIRFPKNAAALTPKPGFLCNHLVAGFFRNPGDNKI